MAISSKRDKRSRSTQTLRITEGIHRGAECNCEEGGIVLLGSSDDCDIILSDPGVCGHHCLVAVVDGRLVVRAVDDAIRVRDDVVEPGEPITVSPFKPVSIAAGVTFAVGQEQSPEWSRLVSTTQAPVGSKVAGRGRRGGAMLIGAALIALTATVAAPAFWPSPEPQVVEERPSVDGFLAKLALPEVAALGDDDAGWTLKGVVADQEELARLRSALDEAHLDVALEVRVGEDIAGDVREVLRMSGVGAQTSYLGDGRVEVRGQFADESAVAEIIDSRAVRDISSLTKVLLVNLVDDEEVVQSELPPGKKIVSVVRGDDPYVITADGSRYYVGAQLPGGGRLHEISDQEIWIDTGTEVRRLDPGETHIKRSST